VLIDRCHQARVKNALEPEWEARFEPRSYGFRPGRGCHDAIEAIYAVCKGPRSRRAWILDADLAAFGSFDHQVMLSALAEKFRDNRFLRLVRNMLQAGYLEDWRVERDAERGAARRRGLTRHVQYLPAPAG
jgi:RNA-directed DNA polymerase